MHRLKDKQMDLFPNSTKRLNILTLLSKLQRPLEYMVRIWKVDKQPPGAKQKEHIPTYHKSKGRWERPANAIEVILSI